MKPDTTDRLLRFLDGSLPPEDAARVQDELAHAPDLRAELETLRAMQRLLRTTVQSSAETAAKPFLTDRVMKRLDPARKSAKRLAPEEELFGSLLRLFRPVALAGMLLILIIAAYNVTLSSGYEAEASTTEAIFALPPVTIATAYDTELLSQYDGTD
jgi:anti-sigma factor RsiW